MYPVPVYSPAYLAMAVALAVGIAASVFYARWARRRQEATGERPRVIRISAALVLGLVVAAWLAGGAPTELDVPSRTRFSYAGGASVTPEFLALLLGLTIYTAGFIAEIVRSGILAVPWGQTEAASSLGLRRGLVLRLVVLPQALRVIVPPMTSQYLNITKNRSEEHTSELQSLMRISYAVFCLKKKKKQIKVRKRNKRCHKTHGLNKKIRKVIHKYKL